MYPENIDNILNIRNGEAMCSKFQALIKIVYVLIILNFMLNQLVLIVVNLSKKNLQITLFEKD